MPARSLLTIGGGLASLALACPPGTVPWPGGPCQPTAAAADDATAFLKENMPNFDTPNAATYFDGGIVVPTVNLSLAARQTFPWAAAVPKDIFNDAVLPYASVNEARTNWRQLLWDKVASKMKEAGVTSLEDAANTLNSKMWGPGWLSSYSGKDKISFKSEQTPLIYDPMSTMMYGYASCTGVSILFIDALRTIGIPARVAGTPAWHGNVSDGNHNWVEVWLGDKVGWAFIEASPAGPGETFENHCDKWFCNKAHFGNSGTQVFAAGFAKDGSSSHYPMAWDLSNKDIPGHDRTADYETMCNKC